jgi:hypothetical protein
MSYLAWECLAAGAFTSLLIGRMWLRLRRRDREYAARVAEIMAEHDVTPPRR